jgi:hypothetical protein
VRLPVWAWPLLGLSFERLCSQKESKQKTYLPFERLCSPVENKKKIQEEAGAQ